MSHPETWLGFFPGTDGRGNPGRVLVEGGLTVTPKATGEVQVPTFFQYTEFPTK